MLRVAALPRQLALLKQSVGTQRISIPLLANNRTMSTNTNTILGLISADHRGILRLHSQLSESTDTAMKQRVLNTLIREIAVHSNLEEAVVYPKIATKQGQHVADQMRQEHQEVKDRLYQLDQIGYVTDVKVMPLLTDIIDHLKSHIKHEESAEIPRLESLLTADENQNLCTMWNTMRPTMPTRPHPSAPDKPPMNVAASAIATPMDRMKDFAREFVDVDKT